MEREFVAFLDKKFRKQDQRFRETTARLVNLQADMKEVKADIRELRTSLNTLTKSVDRFVKLHENVTTEQKAIRADIDRIKLVLKEKLGVQL